jgi:hypothetical protein
MKHALKQIVVTGFLVVCALLCIHGKALAAPNCSLTSPSSLSDIINSYNVFATSNSYSIPDLDFELNCTGMGSTAYNVYVYFLGLSQTYGTYTAPYLSGPDSSKLNFQLCTSNAACTSNFWSVSNPIEITGVTNNSERYINNTTISINVPTEQNIYVGTDSQYTGTVYFAFGCVPTSGGTITQC